ncbi:hypothetical protein ABIE48_005369 [Paenibacillus sp. OAE614]
MKPILSWGIYFCAMFLMSYYFVDMSFVKSIQFSAIITIIHIVMILIDKLTKGSRTISCQLPQPFMLRYQETFV